MAPRNKWTLHQRTALHLLNTKVNFVTDKDANIAKVFNHIYRDDLQNHGYPSGLSEVVMREDYYYGSRHEQFPTRTRMYAEIVMRSSPEQDQRNEEVMKAIKGAITALDLTGTVSPDESAVPSAPLDNESDDEAATEPQQTQSPHALPTSDQSRLINTVYDRFVAVAEAMDQDDTLRWAAAGLFQGVNRTELEAVTRMVLPRNREDFWEAGVEYQRVGVTVIVRAIRAFWRDHAPHMLTE